MAIAVAPWIDVAEYLRLEDKADTRHEYFRGRIYAMAGGTPAHSEIGTNVLAALVVGLRHKPCHVFNGDMRVYIPDTGLFTYPDASVVCGQITTAPDDPNAVVNPVLIVEVLSKSSEAYDRGDKFAHYQTLDSLQHYVLVSQKERRVEMLSRGSEGEWVLTIASGAGADLEIDRLGITLNLDDIYAKVELPAAPPLRSEEP
jgi:Uma2 family endonuclease